MIAEIQKYATEMFNAILAIVIVGLELLFKGRGGDVE